MTHAHVRDQSFRIRLRQRQQCGIDSPHNGNGPNKADRVLASLGEQRNQETDNAIAADAEPNTR